MTEPREVVDMVTKQTQPDSWKQQEPRQRQTTRNRKVGAMVVVAALVLGVIGFAIVVRRPGGKGSVQAPAPTPPFGAQVIGLGGPSCAGYEPIDATRIPTNCVVEQVPGLPDDAISLRLSPDGSTIAFMTADGQVATIGFDGTGMRVLTQDTNTNDGDAQNAVSWSPDGTQIAYAASGDIYVIDADGTNGRRLTTDPKGDYYPAWSPDGSRIAYWNGSATGEDGGPADSQIYTIPPNGGAPTRLTRNNTTGIEPTWSPNGNRLAYFAGKSNIRMMHADGGRNRVIWVSKFILGGNALGDNGGWAPTWSPDGSRIALLKCCSSTGQLTLLEVAILDIASGAVRDLGVNVLTDLNGASWVSNHTLLVNRYD
jgi:Tol biopolymer transport system component